MQKYKSPYYVDFSVTPFCNLKCGFCSASAANNKSNNKSMSLSDIERIFDEFDKNDVLRVSIEGGEPFLRNDIIDILKIADKHVFSYYINTNATLITEDLVKEIAKTKVEKLCISVDGPNENIHDKSRGVKGSFKKTINAIKMLLNHQVSVDAIITLNKSNKDYIIETLEFLKSIGIKNVAIMLLATVGDASENMKDMYVNFDEWKSILVDLTILKKSNKLPVNLNIVSTGESKCPWEIYIPLKLANMADDLKVWISDNNVSTLSNEDFGCTAGKDNLAIDGYGNVYGCSLMISEPNLIAGNIFDNSLSDIWNTSSVFNSMRKASLSDIKGECRECELLYNCKGGCRACAFSLRKSLIESDIRCPLCKKGES